MNIISPDDVHACPVRLTPLTKEISVEIGVQGGL